MPLFTSAPIHPDTRRVLETPQAPSISSVVNPSSWGLLGVASPRLTWLREAVNSSTAAGNKHVWHVWLFGCKVHCLVVSSITDTTVCTLLPCALLPLS